MRTALFQREFTVKEVGPISDFLKQCRKMMGQPSPQTWVFHGNYNKIYLYIYDDKYATWFSLRY